jgi:hypothetical protein
VPSNDVHLACEPSKFQRSLNGLPYPKLDVLAQSFLDTNDRVSLCDLVDGSNVSEEWGVENLELEGLVDLEWAAWKNKLIIEENGGNVLAGLVPIEKIEKRTLWQLVVRNKGARRGWTQPEALFATRFRLHGSPDPLLERRDCC